MTIPEITQTQKLHIMECGECGAPVALSDLHWKKANEEGEGWYCSRGHRRRFSESEIDKLKTRLNQAQELANSEGQKRQIAERALFAERAAISRLKKRATRGVCLYCHRTISQMQRHVATKHPETLK